MDLVPQALRAAASCSAASPAQWRKGLVAGAGGSLGSAVLEQALACGGFARVSALVTLPMDAALRGFEALPFGGFDEALPHGAADTAWVVFDRERHANGREDAFFRPQPDALEPLAQWLHRGGVRRLVLVLPHAPGLLPQALQRGLASLDEHAVAALGFEHVVIVRSAQAAPKQQGRVGGLHRLARLWLSQLHWMIPQHEQPVRAERVAAFAAHVGLALGSDSRLPSGTRVASPELLWRAAQSDDLPALVRAWLADAAPRLDAGPA